MHHFKVNGLSMCVQMAGSGEPLIFVHGLGLDHTFWRWQMPYFATRFKSIAYDLRGHGTTKPVTGSTLEDHANDLSALMERLNLPSAHLVGLSLGSHICKQFIARFPEKVKRMVLVSTRAKGRISNTKRILEEQWNKVGSLDMKLALDIGEKAYFSGHAGQEARRVFRDSAKHNTISSYMTAMEALSGFDHTDILKRMASPALVMNGNEDRLTTAADGAESARLIPGSRLSVMPDAGHFCNLEFPERFNDEVFHFLIDDTRSGDRRAGSSSMNEPSKGGG